MIRTRTFVIGFALALALLLFAQRHPAPAESSVLGKVVDLTHTVNGSVPTYDADEQAGYKVTTEATIEKDQYFSRKICLPEHYGTHIDAPAHFARGLWTVDQIPAERLVAPLVVIDIRDRVRSDPDYRLSMEDVAKWEQANGQIPLHAVVVAHTGWESRWNSMKDYRNPDIQGVMHFPGYSEDAAKFLVEARRVLGLGIDTLSIDYGPSKKFEVHRYTLAHSLYQLENVANLGDVPEKGATVVVAPMKLQGGSGGPVRILALVR